MPTPLWPLDLVRLLAWRLALPAGAALSWQSRFWCTYWE